MKLILQILIMFTLYWLIGWFLSNQSNILFWPWYGKLIYLIFSVIGIRNLIED